jgi:hypothetical protein
MIGGKSRNVERRNKNRGEKIEMININITVISNKAQKRRHQVRFQTHSPWPL